jgi:glycosyltransferase involved in cell wall biosynthesis
MKTISIITIVYNGEDVLEVTMDSVREQTYQGIEYVVIDGASRDGTMDIIERNGDIIDILVSEPDKGIYDAMNKGLLKATGDYVLFLNAGDYLREASVIEEVMSLPNADIYYGETMLVDEDGKELGTRSTQTTRRLPENLSWKDLKKGLVVCHQSFIARRKIAPKYIMGNLSADIDWVIRCLKSAKTVIRYDGIISCFLIGGISKQRHWTSIKDRFKVLTRHFGLSTTILRHFYFAIRHLAFVMRGRG